MQYVFNYYSVLFLSKRIGYNKPIKTQVTLNCALQDARLRQVLTFTILARYIPFIEGGDKDTLLPSKNKGESLSEGNSKENSKSLS